MNITAILKWIVKHYKIAATAILGLTVAFLFMSNISLRKANKSLTEGLEIAQNNIEAYQGSLSGSQQANNVLKLDIATLENQNDSLLKEIDKVRKEHKIKAKDVTAAATQKQTIYVSNSKENKGDIIQIIRDTIYRDTLQYNDLTKVYYNIGKDSVRIDLDLENTQFLYIYSKREYKNKKNFIQRLFTLDWKKVTKYKYEIINTNDLLKESDVRVIENVK